MCLYADVTGGPLPVLMVIIHLFMMIVNNRYAGKETFTTGRTEALYMFTQEM